jgi:two-component sensor histidine kinase
MFKLFFTAILLNLLISVEGLSQSSTQPGISGQSYHPPSEDRKPWQRLNLWLATLYKSAGLFGQRLDSSLIYASHSLGMSRLPVTAEGIDDDELLSQSQWFDQRNPGEGVRMLSKASGKKHLELMLLLGAYYSFQSFGYKNYKDSVGYFLRNALDESIKNNEKKFGCVARCLLVKHYAQCGDTLNRNSVFNELINECNKNGDKKTAARAFTYCGIYTSVAPGTVITQDIITDFANIKIEYLQKAAKIYQEINDVEGEIVALENMGYYYGVLSRLDDSFTALTKALELENSISFPYTHYTTDYLAVTTSSQGKFGEPLKYCMETVNVAEAVRDSIGLATFYSQLGLMYAMEGERDEESLKWMLKALSRYVVAKDPAIYQTLYNIVSLMNKRDGREKAALDLSINTSKKVPPSSPKDSIFHHITFANCYMAMKEYKQAEEYAASADFIRKSAPLTGTNSFNDISMIYTTLASIYFNWGKYANAKKYIELDLATEGRVALLSNDIEDYRQLITIDSVFNDPLSAVKHYKSYMQLVDSNFMVSKVRQAEELQVMYQTKEKENQIGLLKDQSKLEKANLKQATLVKNLTIAGIIAVLIIAGLLYRQNRLRKRNNNLITRKNEQLQHFLDEKEWLLKEIHHRVKNNLQIVMSLLNSQSAYINNDAALTAIHDSQHRVHAMSLIHQKLYNSENVSSIDMTNYIRELVSYLSDSFITGQRIRFEYDIEPLKMDVSQAVPLGLILNEAITNSIKYAFPRDRSGSVSVSLSNTSANHYLLIISDDGVGMPSTIKKSGSLGMSLMKGLSEDLDGNLSVETNNGTTIKISFVQDQGLRNRDSLAALRSVPNKKNVERYQ